MEPLVDAVARNRYLAFTPGDTAGTPQAIRVTLVQSDLVPATLGVQAWVGPVSVDEPAEGPASEDGADWASTGAAVNRNATNRKARPYTAHPLKHSRRHRLSCIVVRAWRTRGEAPASRPEIAALAGV